METEGRKVAFCVIEVGEIDVLCGYFVVDSVSVFLVDDLVRPGVAELLEQGVAGHASECEDVERVFFEHLCEGDEEGASVFAGCGFGFAVACEGKFTDFSGEEGKVGLFEDIDDAFREFAVEQGGGEDGAVGEHVDDVFPLSLGELSEGDGDDLVKDGGFEPSRCDADVVDESSLYEGHRVLHVHDDGGTEFGDGLAPLTGAP